MSEARLPRGSLPTGYSFVPKGNVYVTGNCRKLTKASGRAVFVVVDATDQQIGIGVPIDIYVGVQFQERNTRVDRAANVLKRDEGIAKALQKEIMAIFPRIPPVSLQKVLKFALAKGKGKVGRTSTISATHKARLAVRAHIRHCETDYDALLRKGVKREDARQQVEAKMREVCRAWGPVSTKTEKPSRTAKRLARLAIKSSEQARVAKRLSRLDKKSLELTKLAKKSAPEKSTKEQHVPKVKKAAADDYISKPAKKLMQAAIKRAFAKRIAKGAQREQQGVTSLAMGETKPAKRPQRASATASPKMEPTAARPREKRTTQSTATDPAAPSPTIAQPAAPPSTVAPPVATGPGRGEHRPADPAMTRLSQQHREEILDLVGEIDMHGYYARSGATSSRLERRPVSRGMKQQLHDRINKILADAGLPPAASSLPGREDLVRRLAQRRAPGRAVTVLRAGRRGRAPWLKRRQ